MRFSHHIAERATAAPVLIRILVTVWAVLCPLTGWAEAGNPPENPFLERFSGASDLQAYLKQGLINETTAMQALFTPQMADQTMAAAGSGGDPGLFATGLELGDTAGVLAETAVSDGRFLYVAPDRRIDLAVSLTAAGGEDGRDDPTVPAIGIFEILQDPPATRNVAEIPLTGLRMPVNGLYLFEDAGPAGGAVLVGIACRPHNGWYFWSTTGYWRDRKTELAFFDVSSPRDPTELTRLELDGQLIAARRSGDTLYVVTRFAPRPPGYLTEGPPAAVSENNRRILQTTALEDLLPSYSVNNAPRRPLFGAADCFLVPGGASPHARADMLVLTAIDIVDPERPQSTCLVGPSVTIHVATDTLYLANVRDSSLRPAVISGLAIKEDGPDRMISDATDIHEFFLSEGGPVYRGAGTVPGCIDTLPEDKPFAISVHEDTLRVVTTVPGHDETAPFARLTLLEEIPAVGGRFHLAEVAHLDGLEDWVSGPFTVGFAGHIGYLVPREPAAAIRLLDLSVPAQPTVGGEIIGATGGRHRLFLLEEDTLLGVGWESGRGSAGDPAEGWLGIELLLVNAADPLMPESLDALMLGGPEAPLDTQRRMAAFYAEPPSGNVPGRLAIPVRQVVTAAGAPSISPSPRRIGCKVRTDLYLFDVCLESTCDEAIGFRPRGVLDVVAAEENGGVWDLDHPSDRTLAAGGSLHHIHRSRILSFQWPRAPLNDDPSR